MATNVATLTAKLTADTKQLKKGLAGASRDVDKFEKKTTGATSRAGKGFGSLKTAAAGLGIAVAGAAVVKFAADSIAAFSNLEESVNAVNVVYGEAAEGVHALGVESADTFGLSTRAVNDAAVGMGAFVDKINEADPADAFKNIIQRATDFGSVMNITTEETLEKFRAGLAGESEPLKKFGINVSEAAIQLFALETGLIKSGEKMDEATKIQARYGFIMQETEKTAGDFANTSDGLAGSQKKLTAKWEEAQAELGKKLAPAMTKLIQAGVDLLPVFSLVVDMFGEVIDNAQPMIDLLSEVAGLLGVFSGAAGEAGDDAGFMSARFDDVKDAIGQIIDPVGTAISMFQVLKGSFGGAVEASDELSTSWEAGGFRALELNEEMKTLGGTSVDLGSRWEDLDPKALELNERMKVLGSSFKTTNVRLGTIVRTAKEAREAMRRLADPVFNAERAFDEFNAMLIRVQEDLVVTQDEAEELGESYGTLQAAQDAVGGENVVAAQELISGALGFLDDDTKVTAGNFDSLAETTVDALDRMIANLGGLEVSTPLPIDIELTVPSQAEIRAAMIRELDKLRREGILPAVGF